MPCAEARMLQTERRRQVRRGLSLLSAKDRQALELRAQGLRCREIAETMDLQLPKAAT